MCRTRAQVNKHTCVPGQGLLGTGPRLEGVKLPSQVNEGLPGCPEPWGHGDPAPAQGHEDARPDTAGLHTSLIKHLLLITDTSKKHLPSASISNAGASPAAGWIPWKPRSCGEAAGQADTAPYASEQLLCPSAAEALCGFAVPWAVPLAVTTQQSRRGKRRSCPLGAGLFGTLTS